MINRFLAIPIIDRQLNTTILCLLFSRTSKDSQFSKQDEELILLLNDHIFNSYYSFKRNLLMKEVRRYLFLRKKKMNYYLQHT